MSTTHQETSKPISLEEVHQQFQQWRATRNNKTSRIPDSLWKLVCTIIPHYGRGIICTTLGLSTSQVKSHCAALVLQKPSIDKQTKIKKRLVPADNVFVTCTPSSHITPTITHSLSSEASAEFIHPDGTRFLLRGFAFEQVTAFFHQWLHRTS